jgi:hypothetical protein
LRVPRAGRFAIGPARRFQCHNDSRVVNVAVAEFRQSCLLGAIGLFSGEPDGVSAARPSYFRFLKATIKASKQ